MLIVLPNLIAKCTQTWQYGLYMSQSLSPRVFVPAPLVLKPSPKLEPASADDHFFVVGPPGRHELFGYLLPVDELEPCGVPRKVAREVSMIVSLRTSEHVILLYHDQGVWELLIQSGRGLPDTYTFKV